MTGEHPSTEGGVFEVAIAGGLGPVVTNALMPWVSSGAHHVTIVRARAADRVDIADVVGHLEDNGVTVVEISVSLPDEVPPEV